MTIAPERSIEELDFPTPPQPDLAQELAKIREEFEKKLVDRLNAEASFRSAERVAIEAALRQVTSRLEETQRLAENMARSLARVGLPVDPRYVDDRGRDWYCNCSPDRSARWFAR